MGASNSKPQTVQMTNPSQFQISREVLERVENANNPKKAAVPTACSNCGCSAKTDKIQAPNCSHKHQIQVNQQQQMDNAASWTRRSIEMEEMQFGKALDRVHNLFKQPVKWVKVKECAADIELMEQQLITCYRENSKEPLKCAPLAKQYHSFVFSKQVNTVVNLKSEDGQDAN